MKNDLWGFTYQWKRRTYMSSPAPVSSVANEIFNLIRGQESNFPFPVKRRTVTVGTFNAATGKFKYAVPTFEDEFSMAPLEDVDGKGGPGTGKPPKILKGGRVNAIGAVEVILRFEVENRIGDVPLSIPYVAFVRCGADAVVVSVGAGESVKFTIANRTKKFTSELPLEIVRFVAGAGVFEIPAFPVSIIYAPPADQGQKNVSRWKVTKSTGNTSSFSIREEQTTSRPVAPDFTSASIAADQMRLAANALDRLNKLLNDGTVKAISKALKVVAGGLGSVSVTEADGVSSVKQQSVTLSVDKEQTITTSAASGGPGSGDLIHYLKNVKFVWFTRSVGQPQVLIIGHDGIGVTSTGFLKSGGQTDLDPQTVAEFLKLDPFVAGGPSAALPPERFVYLDTIDINGGEISQTETYSVTDENLKQSTTSHTRIENSKPGFLKFLGLGVTDESSTETIIEHSSAVQSSDTRKVSNTIHLFAGPDERYSVEVYYDVIFGTFAYRQVRSSPIPVLKGMAFGKDGKVAALKIVKLINQGRKFTTRTDSAGRYAFHANTIKPGKFQVIVGGVKKTGTLVAGKTKFDIEA
jgi:hypothetical protein